MSRSPITFQMQPITPTAPHFTVDVPHECCPRCFIRSPHSSVRMRVTLHEHMEVWTCPQCRYEAKNTSSEMRMNFMNAVRYEYMNPQRGMWISRGEK